MVRGLLIRQALTAVNFVLAVGIAYVIYLIGTQQFGYAQAPASLDLEGIADTELQIAKVGPREEYNAIVNAGMFGNAGKAAPVVEEDPNEEPELVPTTAPLTLHGTSASYPSDPLATAIIENPTAATPIKVATFYQGQEVMPGLMLLEVHRRRVILHNESKNQNEELVMAQLGSQESTAKSALPDRRGRQGAEKTGDNPNHVTLERQAVLDEVNAYNYTDLIAELNPQLVEDDKGNVIGISSATLENIPLAQSAGLKNNDVIQSINGMNIDSEQKIGEIAQRIGNANTIRLSITREGKPQTLTIKVQ
ncbi:MAG: site-2 protease family protein [Candidatus Hydrogenedentes bacterium]|nr:site-2 protease family protein [Candidatus Hydrogenedentota bacterium]